MFQKSLLCIAIAALAFASGAQAKTKPAPALIDDTPSVLNFVAWLGKLPYLANSRVVTERLKLRPQSEIVTEMKGRREHRNYVNVLERAPAFPQSTMRIDYTIFYPAGTAAHTANDGLERARIFISFTHGRDGSRDPVRVDGQVCIHEADMIKRFGRPDSYDHVTDGGGRAPNWLLGRAAGGWTYVGGYFGPNEDQCTDDLRIWQQTRRAPSEFPRVVPLRGKRR